MRYINLGLVFLILMGGVFALGSGADCVEEELGESLVGVTCTASDATSDSSLNNIVRRTEEAGQVDAGMPMVCIEEMRADGSRSGVRCTLARREGVRERWQEHEGEIIGIPESVDVSISSIADSDSVAVTVGDDSFVTNEPLFMDEDVLVMRTDVGTDRAINVLPKDIKEISKVSVAKDAIVGTVKLTEEDDKAVYDVALKEDTMVLAFIPVTLNVEAKIDAESGEVLSIQKPWWTSLTSSSFKF